jgi:hypothetical protein
MVNLEYPVFASLDIPLFGKPKRRSKIFPYLILPSSSPSFREAKGDKRSDVGVSSLGDR